MDYAIESRFKPFLKPKTVYAGGKNPPKDVPGKVYKLSSNENPLGQSPRATEALLACVRQLDVYPDQTDVRLREAVVADLGPVLTADQVLCGNSGSELIDMILRAFVNEGDEVIYSNPCFLPYSIFSRWYGAELVDVPLKGPDYALDVEGILAAITDRTRVVFLTSPNNPTGTYIPKPAMDAFMERVPKDVLIVFDEVYRHFADAEDYVTALPYVEQGLPVVGLNSFSKTYGLAGLRVGYLYTTPVIAHYLRQIHKPFLLPLPGIEGAIAALEDRDFIGRTVEAVRSGRAEQERIYQSLGIEYWPSQGNFFLIEPPLPEFEFTERMMAEGIMVRPVSQFGAPGKVRISVGTSEANAALEHALRQVMGR